MSVLPSSSHLLSWAGIYEDLGPGRFDALNHDRGAESLIRRLQALGFVVDARPAAA